MRSGRCFFFNAKCFITALFFLLSQFTQAQLPTDLPWPGGQCSNESIILQSGIAGVTCGVTTAVPPLERWTFGLINIEGAIPESGREETTATQAVYHHPSWTVEQIGNVYGIAINNTNGCMFLTASSNYGAGVLKQPTVIQYGNIGGGADDLGAAGTVYKLDAVTGQASVFAQLPQQSTALTHQDCEGETIINRNTGVGLGNIAYDEVHDQYFVSNIEDGRIYRLNNAGSILDSYDPLMYDDGAAGISNLEETAYGLAVENDGSRVFFGTITAPGGGNNPGTGLAPIYSIDLDVNGGFVGTVNNTILPAGVPNNYVGTETFHTNIPIGSSTGCTFTSNTTYQVSDLTFDPAGNLLVGIREGCENSFQTSYAHWGETNIITSSGNLYNNSVTELDISATGQCGNEDGYGGVAYWDLQDGSGDLQYAVSSSDILFEQGPHGIAVFDATNASTGQINPLGAISYGVVDTDDPKGIGGEVEIFSAPNCCAVNCQIAGTTNASCATRADATLSINGLDSPSGSYEYSIDNGLNWVSNAGVDSYTFTALSQNAYTVLVRDLADPTGCVSSCSTSLGCEGTVFTETEIVSGFANINSTGGTNPTGLPGAVEPVGSTGTTSNSSDIGNLNRTIVLEFDDVLPIGTVVTISMAVNNNIPFFPASATITDFTNTLNFSGGNVNQLQYIPFTLGQATNKITIDSDNNTFNIFGALRVDGASYTNAPIVTETFVCNVCPQCTCSITNFENISCNDGSLTAIGAGSVSGNYEFSLDAFATAGQTSGVFSSLPAGVYTLTVRDPADILCQSTCTITLTEPEAGPPKCINDFGEFTIIKRRP